jgi:osmoprotectant transport system permease protein
MGMSRRQIFRRIEAPLAAPLVLEGVRTASVQSVGLTAVAALIGAGGLGWFIFRGLGQAASDLIILGAIPIILLALLVDAIMRAIVRIATPKGMARIS